MLHEREAALVAACMLERGLIMTSRCFELVQAGGPSSLATARSSGARRDIEQRVSTCGREDAAQAYVSCLQELDAALKAAGMPVKHMNGFWLFELDQAVEISSLTIIDSREGKAQRMSVTNSYFHDGLNCGINLRGAQEVLIANSHSERTRTGGIVAMEDYWWGEGGFPGMLPIPSNTAKFRELGHCTHVQDQSQQWRVSMGLGGSVGVQPPCMVHMQILGCIDLWKQHLHTFLHVKALIKRGPPAPSSETLPRPASTHVDARHACSSASEHSQAVVLLQVMWCCGTTRCTTHTTRKMKVPQSVLLPLGWTITPQVLLCSPSAAPC